MTKIGFIGTGNMGGALALAAGKKENNEVLLFDKLVEKAEQMKQTIGSNAKVCSLEGMIQKCDFLFLGVKPQQLDDLCLEIKEYVAQRNNLVMITMAAGTTIDSVSNRLEYDGPVIRIMPNTPVSVEAGMILYVTNAKVDPKTEDDFLKVMEKAGLFKKVLEKQIDAGSAVSGCGPAFVAMFLEALADGGVACGLSRNDANEMAAQMVYGTAKMVLENKKIPEEVKDAVCSPGGTTIQGVKVLEEKGFRGAVIDAVISAYEKNFCL